MDETLHLKLSGAVATVTLTRPGVHNAIDAPLAANLTAAFQKLGVAEAVRAVVLRAEGESFCAGVDLGWLRRMGGADPADAQREAMVLAVLLDAVDRCPKPVVAVVQGPALGLGAALVAAADMAVASEGASFGLTEVRLGLPPAVTAPHLAAAIGPRASRRYLLTGERFDAREAMRLGLVGGVVASDKLVPAAEHLVAACLRGGPKAQEATKEVLRLVADTPMGPDLMRLSALRLAEGAASEEAGRGIAAAAEGRLPEW